ncbi:hypothetical protein BBP40_000935 [Aspergillus hancockii]|nr:hypothetical protein BBP40_000935 [Aspergillus hancockii]
MTLSENTLHAEQTYANGLEQVNSSNNGNHAWPDGNYLSAFRIQFSARSRCGAERLSHSNVQIPIVSSSTAQVFRPRRPHRKSRTGS